MHIFIDLEASSLSYESYPVEVAWSNGNGNIESHLINVSLYPADWTDWSTSSEKLHGLSREYLIDNGDSPIQVAERMNVKLSCHDVYSDAVEYDVLWLDQLYKACGLRREFNVRDFYSLLPDEIVYSGYMGNSGMLEDFQRQARKRAGVPPHRAANDVKYLIEMYVLVGLHY